MKWDKLSALRAVGNRLSPMTWISVIWMCMVVMLVTQVMLANAAPITLPPPYRLPGDPLSHMLIYRSVIYTSLCFLLALVLVGYLEARGHLTSRLRYSLAAFSLAGAAVAALTYYVGSFDLTYYIAYGRKFGILGMSPYTPLNDANFDPLIKSVKDFWKWTPAAYGPTSILFFALLNLISVPTMGALIITYKIAWFGVFLLFAWLLQRVLRSCISFRFTRWFALCANPVIWMMCLRDAHLELLLMCLMTACFLAAYKQKWIYTGLLFGLLCGVKMVVLPLIPIFAWYVYRTGSREGGISRVSHFLGAWASYMLPVYVAFGGAEWASLFKFSLSAKYCLEVVPWISAELMRTSAFNMGKVAAEDMSVHVGNVLFPLGMLFLLIRMVRVRGEMNLAGFVGVTLLWLMVTRGYVMAWYVLWSMMPLVVGAAGGVGLYAVTVVYTLASVTNDPCMSRTFMALVIMIPISLFIMLKLTASLTKPPDAAA